MFHILNQGTSVICGGFFVPVPAPVPRQKKDLALSDSHPFPAYGYYFIYDINTIDTEWFEIPYIE